MLPLEPVPVIRRIETDRDDLCALEVVGRLRAGDLENAYGLLEGAYAVHEKIDLLVRLAQYEGFDWSAVFSRSTVRGKLRALRHIRKYAVVGGPRWVRTAIGLFRPLTPIETRWFDAADEQSAWAWLDAHPVETA